MVHIFICLGKNLQNLSESSAIQSSLVKKSIYYLPFSCYDGTGVGGTLWLNHNMQRSILQRGPGHG